MNPRTPPREGVAPPVTPEGVDLLGFALELLAIPDGVEKSDPTPAAVPASDQGTVDRTEDTFRRPGASDTPSQVPEACGAAGEAEPSSARADARSPQSDEASAQRASSASPRAPRGRTSANRFGALGEFVAQSAGVQLALMAAAGIGVLVVWTLLERHALESAASIAPLKPEAVESSVVRPFPKLEMHGADRVREEEVQVLLEPKKSAPAPLSEAASTERGVVVLRPGQLVDDENGQVIEVEGAARRTAPVSSPRARSQGSEPTAGAGARFFAPGGLLTGASPPRAAADAGLALQVGDRFRVKLEVGVVSSVREDVLASAVEDVVRNGRLILAKGDMLRGTTNHDDKRIFIRFRAAENAGRWLQVSAYAVDGAMPGLVARRREATVEERTRSRAAENVLSGVAAEAGAALTGAAAVGRIAERVANGAAAEAADAVQLDRSWVLEVSAGRTFEVVITEAKKT